MQLNVKPHILLDETGTAWIDGTKIKVIEVVLDKVAKCWSPEEIHFQHPDLSLAQIHAALSYYYDHQGELDREIERRFQETEEFARKVDGSLLNAKLRAAGNPP